VGVDIEAEGGAGGSVYDALYLAIRELAALWLGGKCFLGYGIVFDEVMLRGVLSEGGLAACGQGDCAGGVILGPAGGDGEGVYGAVIEVEIVGFEVG